MYIHTSFLPEAAQPRVVPDCIPLYTHPVRGLGPPDLPASLLGISPREKDKVKKNIMDANRVWFNLEVKLKDISYPSEY